MNDYDKEQEEYYFNAMKSLTDAEKDFNKLTPANKEKFVEQVVKMYGVSEIIKRLK